MSANNELIVAPSLEHDLKKYGVWYNGCVDNPFDFGREPQAVFDTFEEAYRFADEQNDYTIEYGVRVIFRDKITGYRHETWDEFPDYGYLAPVFTAAEKRRLGLVETPLSPCTSSLHDD